MSQSLNGSSALVTGSTSGIGRAIAEVLAQRGAYVILSGRNAARGERAVAEIRAAGGKAEFVQAELSDAPSARKLARQAMSFTGSIDILVNNAGIYPFQSTIDTDEGLFDAIHNLNVKVPFFLAAELAPAMLERATDRSSTCPRSPRAKACPEPPPTAPVKPRWTN
jgi:NAD(P)-dependent dehydrogenase (short-subunit alcohol dehydrogenase family)